MGRSLALNDLSAYQANCGSALPSGTAHLAHHWRSTRTGTPESHHSGIPFVAATEYSQPVARGR